MGRDQRDEYDWIETLVGLAGKLGFNQVRLRWKLRAWQDRQKARGESVKGKAAAVKREHKLCPVCQGINGMDEKVCIHCGSRLRSRQAELGQRVVRRFGLGLSVETLLAACFAVAYVMVAIGGESSSVADLSAQDLVVAGGNFAPLTLELQFWRLWTSVFLHGGLMHIGFNTVALLYLAPTVKEVYGGNKAMVAFLLTGVAASLVSLIWSLVAGGGVSIGASGAVCGLIGLMAVWGHRDRTHIGIGIRNGMLRWILIIIVFGLFVGADHAAHFGGLAAGSLLALVLPPNIHRGDSAPWRVAGTAATLASLAAVAGIGWLMLG